MIITERSINTNKGVSKINDTIILYRGDFRVQVKFRITNSKFKFLNKINLIESENAAYGQLAILTPHGGNIFSEVSRCDDGAVTFTFTEEMINEISEVGLYSFQIRLFDTSMESRITIPPVEFGIEVREPIAAEDHTDEVGVALPGYSIANMEPEGDTPIEPAFDEEGNYIKTEWNSGMRISANRLNKMEDAIDTINQNGIDTRDSLTRQMTSNFSVLQGELNAQIIALQTELNSEIERLEGDIAYIEEIIDEIVVYLIDSDGNYLADIDGYKLINITI